VLSVVVLLLPFCACHVFSLMGRSDGCCRGAAVTATSAPSCCDTACHATDEAASECFDALEARTPAHSGNAPEPAPDRPRIPGCSGDTCCVKCAPQTGAWQMPEPICVATVVLEAMTPHDASRSVASAWPPTLPLGQPPTLLERGTLLLI